MSEDEEQEQLSCKEIQLLGEKFDELVQRVTIVMPLADYLKSRNMIHDETYSKIKAEKTHQDQMRELLKALHSGGDKVKKAFCKALKQNDPYLFNNLGDDNKKRKLSDAECHVPAKQKKLNTESDEPFNYNDGKILKVGSPSICNVTNIYTAPEKNPVKPIYTPHIYISPHNFSPCIPHNSNSAVREKKPPALKKEKKPPTLKEEKKPPAPKKEKNTPAPKKEKKPPAPKKEKKPPAPKEEKKPPAPKEEKKPLALKKEKKPPAPKKEKKPPAPKKVKKPPAPKKVKKPPAPKK